jgi:predicted O-methyltransferase YrrM
MAVIAGADGKEKSIHMKKIEMVPANVVILLVAAVVVLLAQAPGGPGRFGFGGPPVVENAWSALAFEIKVDDATLLKLRPYFQSAADAQRRLRDQSAGDPEALVQGTQKIQSELNQKVRPALTEDQARKLAAFLESCQRPGPPPEGFGGIRPGPDQRGPGPGPRGGISSSWDISTVPKNDAEKRILETAEQVARYLNVPFEDGRIIRLFAEAIGAKNAAEIGTSTGYSGLWFAAGLRAAGGKLTTFEIDPGRAAAARQNFRKAGVDKFITVVQGDAHEEVKKLTEPIDILFIDADKPGYLDYLQKLLPLVRPGGLVLAHNIGDRNENPAYVDAVVKDPNLETILVGSGMTVTLKKR